MAGFEIVDVETTPSYLAAEVRFTAEDGRIRTSRYSWPAQTSEAEILKILTGFYRTFEAEGAAVTAKASALKGYKHEAPGRRGQ